MPAQHYVSPAVIVREEGIHPGQVANKSQDLVHNSFLNVCNKRDHVVILNCLHLYFSKNEVQLVVPLDMCSTIFCTINIFWKMTEQPTSLHNLLHTDGQLALPRVSRNGVLRSFITRKYDQFRQTNKMLCSEALINSTITIFQSSFGTQSLPKWTMITGGRS